jgi:hypothetical protein
LFIGHANKPRCFKGKLVEKLGIYYLHNKKAWMTSLFFENYFRCFNDYDNAPSHAFGHLEIPNLEICRLLANTTSRLQPLDAGIISSFKRHYHKHHLEHALHCIEIGQCPYKAGQLTAMHWIWAACNEIDLSVFVNCLRHSMLLLSSVTSTPVESIIQPQDDELTELIANLHLENPLSVEVFLNPIEDGGFEWWRNIACINSAEGRRRGHRRRSCACWAFFKGGTGKSIYYM